MADPITDHIKTTVQLLAAIKTPISSIKELEKKTITYGGTSVAQLIKDLMTIPTPPMAALVYTGSSYQNDPLRSANISIIVVTKHAGLQEESAEANHNLRDKVIAAVDHLVVDDLVIRVTGDRPLTLEGTYLSAYEIQINVEDQ